MINGYLDRMRSELRKYAVVPDTELEKILPMLKLMEIKRNQYFINIDDLPDKMAFVISGIFRVFCISKSGEEKILVFRDENHVLSGYDPNFPEQKALYAIQALENSKLVYITIQEHKKLLQGHPCWTELRAKYFHMLYMEKVEREREFLSEDASTRFLNLTKTEPGFVKRIPQYYIASYLGVTPEALSRIRKSLKFVPS